MRAGILLTFILVALQKLRGALTHGFVEHPAEVGRILIAAKRADLLNSTHAAQQKIACPGHAKPCAVFRRRFVEDAAEQPAEIRL